MKRLLLLALALAATTTHAKPNWKPDGKPGWRSYQWVFNYQGKSTKKLSWHKSRKLSDGIYEVTSVTSGMNPPEDDFMWHASIKKVYCRDYTWKHLSFISFTEPSDWEKPNNFHVANKEDAALKDIAPGKPFWHKVNDVCREFQR